MQHLTTLNPQNATESEINSYNLREAARAIVLDAENNVAILHVTNEKYYKIPSGGIEHNENKIDALKRECLEEIGCEIKVIDEIGVITENRKMFKLNQVSYCYFAKVVGEKGNPEFTEDEIKEGFELLWIPYEKAQHLISTNITVNQEGKQYIVPRDSIFITEAKKYIQKD